MNTRALKSIVRKNEEDAILTALANVLGVSISTAWTKLSGKVAFKPNEIDVIRKHYNLSDRQVVEIFIEQEESNG